MRILRKIVVYLQSLFGESVTPAAGNTPKKEWNWRGGRVAESTGLLNLHTGNRITSSNLVLSATD